jgi:hypothetical protein
MTTQATIVPTVSPQANIPAAKEQTPIKLGFFPGAFARFQTGAYGDLKRGGLPSEVAHKVASDYGSDIARAMSKGDAKVATKVAKANKDGTSRLSISGKGETTLTHSMAVVRVAQVIDSLYGEGLIDSRIMPKLSALASEDSDSMADYVARCGKWASEQKWEA